MKYLELDLRGLYEILREYAKKIFNTEGIDITKSLTASSLALKIFRKNYYKNNIPLVNIGSLYNDMSQAFFGGMTEVYKPHIGEGYYYDVTSLYPAAAVQNPLPGGEFTKYVENTKEGEELFKLEDIFGFVYAQVETQDLPIGLLPVRIASGVIMPRGEG